MTDNIIAEPPILTDHILTDTILTDPLIKPLKGCINRNFCSSTLFLAPAIYSYMVNYSKVMWGSLICFLTSTAHHYYKAQNKILRRIDIVCVNSIAAYFLINCLMYVGCTFYANIMYGFAIAALVFYFYLLFKPHLYEKYHCLVHILAITGIMFYIKAYTECLSKNLLSSTAGD